MIKVFPEHCKQCIWFYEKMGACPNPQVSIIWTYMSIIPYLIIFILITLTLITRRLSVIRLTSTLILAYIIGDKVLKNVFQSQRPIYSCKDTYGMPSSHMTVIVGITFYFILNKKINLSIKLIFIVLSILQGFARIYLNYHTLQQVIGGTIFGIIFTLVFFKFFDEVLQRTQIQITKYMPFIHNDLNKQYRLKFTKIEKQNKEQVSFF